MKVLMVSPSFYPAVGYGGPIFATLHLAENLAKQKNIQIYVVTTNANVNKKLNVKTNTFLKLKNFLIKYYNETIINRFSFSMMINLIGDIKKADIIYVQSIFSTPTPFTLFYAKIFQKPVLLSPRGSLSTWGLNNKKKFLKKLWLNLFIRPFIKDIVFHVTSLKEKNDVKKFFPNNKIVMIPDGINFSEFNWKRRISKREYLKKFIGKEIDCRYIIISMGRIHKVKGMDILIKSFSQLKLDGVLLIAGKDDGEKGKLKQLVKNLKLENKVFFIGEVFDKDKVLFLKGADLFVLPSHTENFGIVYLESLACGTPIVASKNTPWEIVEKYNCGKWVENSVEDIARAMKEMLSIDKKQIKNNCVNLAKHYDWSNIAKEFVKTYEEMKKGQVNGKKS